MAESDQHQQLIQRIVDYVNITFASKYSLTTYHDLPKAIGAEKPPAIGNFRPDFYAVDVPLTITIIGEAKTFNDLETEHSRNQYLSFISYLSQHDKGYFILAIPFQYVPATRRVISNLLRRIGAPCNDVVVIILDEIGEYAI